MSQSFRDAVTRFIFLEDQPEKSDIIFLPGSPHDAHVQAAADLMLEGYAPLVLPSGLHSKQTDHFSLVPGFPSEWAWMRSLLMERGVPEEKILREDRATFTWENATLSRALTDRLHLHIRQALLCCTAHHARRALFYYQAAFPEARILVVPRPFHNITGENWYTTGEGRETVLGEVRRLGSQVLEIYDCLEEGRIPPLLHMEQDTSIYTHPEDNVQCTD